MPLPSYAEDALHQRAVGLYNHAFLFHDLDDLTGNVGVAENRFRHAADADVAGEFGNVFQGPVYGRRDIVSDEVEEDRPAGQQFLFLNGIAGLFQNELFQLVRTAAQNVRGLHDRERSRQIDLRDDRLGLDLVAQLHHHLALDGQAARFSYLNVGAYRKPRSKCVSHNLFQRQRKRVIVF